MEENQVYTIILRHDTSTNWIVNDPVLALGEYGVEDDTHRVKRGDGQTKWSELLYESFGLEYIVTYKNLSGDISENEQLQEALDSKLNKDIFKDSNNQVVTGITITSEDNKICKINKGVKNVLRGTTDVAYIDIVSNDNSINGIWTSDTDGTRILNLQAVSAIGDYKRGIFYKANQLCFYENTLYRAKETIYAEKEFDYTKWIPLSTLDSFNIKFNAGRSNLTSTNVESAIQEVSNKVDTKVSKSDQANKLYGTDSFGEQVLIDKDELGKVDTVNTVRPDASKNVTIESKDINYDTTVNSHTVKQVLDSKASKTELQQGLENKVDKDIADTIVTNVKLSTSADIPTLTVTKTDSESKEDTNVDLHLQIRGDLKTYVENDTVIVDSSVIDTHIQDLKNSSDSASESIRTLTNDVNSNKIKIDSLTNTSNTLSTDVNQLKTDLDNTNKSITDLDSKIDTNTNNLNTKIETVKTDLDRDIETLTTNVETVDNSVDSLKTVVDSNTTEIDTLKESLGNTDTNIENIQSSIESINSEIVAVKSKNTEQDTAINKNTTDIGTLNTNLTNSLQALNEKDTEQDTAIQALDTRLDSVDTTLGTVNTDIANLKNKDTEIDNSISGINTNIGALQTKDSEILQDIQDIQTKNTEQDTAITNLNTKTSTHDTNITDLQTKDSEIDTKLGEIDTKLNEHSESITNLTGYNTTQDTAITNLDKKIDTNVENLTKHNETQDTNISTNTDNITKLSEKESTDVQALKDKDSEQDTRMTNIETKNTEQDGRLTAVETKNTEQDTSITNMDTTLTEQGKNINKAVQDVKDLDTKVQAELKDIQQVATDQATMIESMSNAIDTVNGSITNIKLKNTEQDKAIDSLRTTVNSNNDVLTESVDAITQVNQAQNEQLTNINGSISNINNTLADLTDLITNVEDLEAQLDAKYGTMLEDVNAIKEKDVQQDTRMDGIDTTIEGINTNITNMNSDMQSKFSAVNTNIDTINSNITAINTKDTEQDTRMDGIDTSITTTNTAIETLSNDTDDRFQTVAQDISELQSGLETTNTNVSTNVTNITKNANDISGLDTRLTTAEGNINTNATNITALQNNKLNANFASSVDNSLVSDISVLEPSASASLYVLKRNKLNVSDGSTSTTNFNITSTDNTLVATPIKDDEGNVTGIDLATNLDTDVNYFITSQTLSETIGATNTIGLDTITSITKTGVEVMDIITDSEGTWSRVQSIDTTNNQCTCITFQRQKDAVWGTIQGNIKDQTDLKSELDNLTSGYKNRYNNATLTNTDNIMNIQINSTDVESVKKVLKVEMGEGLTQTLKNADHNLLKVNTETATFDAKESKLTSNTLGNVIRELKTLDDAKVKTTDFNTYKGEVTQNLTDVNNSIDTLSTNTTSSINSLKTELETKITTGDSTLQTNIDTVQDNLDASNARIATLETDTGDLKTRTSTLETNTSNLSANKLDKQQGTENKGKHLIVGEDGQVKLETLVIDTGVATVTSDYNLVDNTDEANPKILKDSTKLDKDFSDKYLTKFGTEANETQGVLQATTRKTADKSDVVNTVDIIGKGGIKITSAYATDTDNDTITVDATTISTNLTNGLDSKVDKSTSQNVIYGTDENGEQVTYVKNTFGQVDTVNGRTIDSNKNVSVDATVIKIDDTDTNSVTVKDSLDSKLDKVGLDTVIYGTNNKGEQVTYPMVNNYLTNPTISTNNNEITFRATSVSKDGAEEFKTNKLVVPRQDIKITAVTDSTDIQLIVDPAKIQYTDTNTQGTLSSKNVSSAISELALREYVDNESLTNTLETVNDTLTQDITDINTTLTGIQTNITTLDTNKLDKVATKNVLYGTDGEGTQTTYSTDCLGKVEKVNNVLPDSNKAITIDANDIHIDKSATTKVTVKEELNKKLNITTNVGQNTLYGMNKQGEVTDYILGDSTSAVIDILNRDSTNTNIFDEKSNTVSMAYKTHNYSTGTETNITNILFTVKDGIVSSTSDTGMRQLGINSEAVPFVPGDSGLTSTNVSNAIKEVQTNVDTLSNDSVKSVNSLEPDNNGNVLVTAQNITGVDNKSVQTNITELTQRLELSIPTQYQQNTGYKQGQYVWYLREDNITLMARVLQNYTSDSTQTNLIDSYKLDIANGKISLVGIPLDWNGDISGK